MKRDRIPEYHSPPEDQGLCPLCGREMIEGPSLNRHHLIPRTEGGTEAFTLHRICHNKIHSVLSEKELARWYHTWDRLREHEEIAKFIRWVKKKPPELYLRHDDFKGRS